jgi:hypothetical protein
MTTTRRDRQRGHIRRPSKLESGKFGPRVQTKVSRSSSRVYRHLRRDFMPSRLPQGAAGRDARKREFARL